MVTCWSGDGGGGGDAEQEAGCSSASAAGAGRCTGHCSVGWVRHLITGHVSGDLLVRRWGGGGGGGRAGQEVGCSSASAAGAGRCTGHCSVGWVRHLITSHVSGDLLVRRWGGVGEGGGGLAVAATQELAGVLITAQSAGSGTSSPAM